MYHKVNSPSGGLLGQLRYRSYIVQLLLVTLLASLVTVYFLLGSISDPDSAKAASGGEPDALDKYLNQQFQFLGNGKSGNSKDPTAKEKQMIDQLSNSMMLNNQNSKCVLTRERINSTACKGELKETVEYRDVKGEKIYTKVTKCGDSMDNGRPWVMFLHGLNYNTRNWVEINMLRVTAKLGFNNIAVDLPSFGASNGTKVPTGLTKEQFLEELVTAAGLKDQKLIIVTPSMSGQFAVPYLKMKGTAPDTKLVGFVAAAPMATEVLKDFDLATIKTKTLVIYGVRDDNLGKKSEEVLSKIPNSKVVQVPNAGHPSYLDNTDAFMREMFKFFLCDILTA